MRALIVAASLLIATPSLATEWIYCTSADETASVGLLVGGADFASVVAITLNAGDSAWASSETYGPGQPIAVEQAYIGDNQIIVDLSDLDRNQLIAELRAYTASEGNDYVQGGVLRVPGKGAWAVSCEGP
ncbi:MAG: hypothetical protein ABIQ30_02345 [Devosia sp.]